MAIDDILKWIAIENISIVKALTCGRNEGDRDTLLNLVGQLDALEKLRKHILMKTNPHNREDIRKFNERESE